MTKYSPSKERSLQALLLSEAAIKLSARAYRKSAEEIRIEGNYPASEFNLGLVSRALLMSKTFPVSDVTIGQIEASFVPAGNMNTRGRLTVYKSVLNGKLHFSVTLNFEPSDIVRRLEADGEHLTWDTLEEALSLAFSSLCKTTLVHEFYHAIDEDRGYTLDLSRENYQVYYEHPSEVRARYAAAMAKFSHRKFYPPSRHYFEDEFVRDVISIVNEVQRLSAPILAELEKLARDDYWNLNEDELSVRKAGAVAVRVWNMVYGKSGVQDPCLDEGEVEELLKKVLSGQSLSTLLKTPQGEEAIEAYKSALQGCEDALGELVALKTES